MLTLIRYSLNATPPNCCLCRKRTAAYYYKPGQPSGICQHCLTHYIRPDHQIVNEERS